MSRSFHWNPTSPPPPPGGSFDLTVAHHIAAVFARSDDAEDIDDLLLNGTDLPVLRAMRVVAHAQFHGDYDELIAGVEAHGTISMRISRCDRPVLLAGVEPATRRL